MTKYEDGKILVLSDNELCKITIEDYARANIIILDNNGFYSIIKNRFGTTT